MKKIYFTLFIFIFVFISQIFAQAPTSFTAYLSADQERIALPTDGDFYEFHICGFDKNADYTYWFLGETVTFTADSECLTLPYPQALANPLQYTFSVEKHGTPTEINLAKSVANIEIQDFITAEEAVQDILIGGDCFDVTDIEAIGQSSGLGSFTNGMESIGIESGVILASGNVTNALGPNNSNSKGTTLAGSQYDADLAQLSSGNVEDASGLEFFFTPTTEIIEFEYVFASEEYCEYVNSAYNDVFGFFISGPGINGEFQFNAENIARIPGSSDNVSINNVNHLENSEYFVPNRDNCGSAPLHPETIQYDGFTTVLTAYANVVPCETYRIRLVVSDVQDAAFDSAVFLAANSFNAVDAAVVEANSSFTGTNTAYEGCENGEFNFSRDSDEDMSEDLTIEFFVSPLSTALPAQDYLPFPTTVTIPAGEMSVSLPIEIIDDGLIEGEEALILEVPASCSCSQSTVELLLRDVEPLQIEPADPTVCGTETATLTAAPQGGMGDYSYLWNDGTTQSTVTVPAFGGGTQDYTVTVTDACGNETFATSTVTAVAPPEAVISGSGAHCDEDTNTLIDLTVEFTGAGLWEFTYSQNGTVQTLISTDQNPYILPVNGLGDYLLESVSYADGYCAGTVSGAAEIVESDLPVATISGTGDHCAEDTETLVGLTLEITENGPWEISYRYNGVLQPALTVTETPYVLEVNGLGIYELESVSFADGHCPGITQGSAEIVESELPTATLTGAGNFCPEDENASVPVTVEFTGSGPWEFTWLRDGITQETLTATENPFTFNVNELGTYTLGTVSYLQGHCDGTTAGSAEIVPTTPPTAFLSGAGELCPNQTETFVYLPVEFTGAGPWEFSYSRDGVLQETVSTNENPYQLPVNAIGNYALESVSFAGGLCDGNPSGTAQITEAAIDLALEITDAECADTNTGSIRVTPLEGTAPFTYDWNVPTLTTDNPTALFAGTYNLTLTDAQGCTAAAVALVGQPERIVATAEKAEGLCEGDRATITFTEVAGGSPEYVYSIDNGAFFSGNPVFERVEGGEYDLLIQDLNGCEWADKITIVEPTPLELSVEPLTVISLGDNHDIIAEINIPPYTLSEITWTNSTTLDCTDCLDPTASPLRTTAYRITITTEKGCTKSAETVIEVDNDSPVFIPNVFSPDGDGRNDLLTVFAKDAAVTSVNSLNIFSRWGENVYSDLNITPNDIQRGWDGTYRGKAVGQGVFLWFAEVEYADGTTEMLKGDVTVLR